MRLEEAVLGATRQGGEHATTRSGPCVISEETPAPLSCPLSGGQGSLPNRSRGPSSKHCTRMHILQRHANAYLRLCLAGKRWSGAGV